MDLATYESLEPCATVPVDGRQLTYYTPTREVAWRVETLFTKEPDTIAWLNTMSSGEVLFDIGANVGMYTIWAAGIRDVTVFAFEPEAQNYAVLNRNIQLNGLDRLVQAYCLGIGSENGPTALHLHPDSMRAGGSCHSIGAPLDFHNRPRASGFKQGCFSVTIDSLVRSGRAPVPTHIKVDVDGLEHQVLAGCRETIARPELKTVLIELNTALDEHWEVVDEMVDAGFTYSEEEASRARRTSGAFEGVGNYVFRR